MQAMLESQQKKLNSPIPHSQESYSFSPIQNDQPSTLKTSMECFRESELQFQNMLDSQFSLSFQNQDSYTPFLEHPLAENQV